MIWQTHQNIWNINMIWKTDRHIWNMTWQTDGHSWNLHRSDKQMENDDEMIQKPEAKWVTKRTNIKNMLAGRQTEEKTNKRTKNKKETDKELTDWKTTTDQDKLTGRQTVWKTVGQTDLKTEGQTVWKTGGQTVWKTWWPRHMEIEIQKSRWHISKVLV